MTLTIAINLDDFVIITADQRLTIHCKPFTNLPETLYSDNYKKINIWKHGAMTSSGDVLLMHCFYELLQVHANDGDNTWRFIEIAQQAREIFLEIGHPKEEATGSALFSLYNLGTTHLIHLTFDKTSIRYETIPAIQANFCLFAGTPDDPIYQAFVSALRRIRYFDSFSNFFNYNVNLIKAFYKRQQSFDDTITSTFDIFIQHRKSGKSFLKTIYND